MIRIRAATNEMGRAVEKDIAEDSPAHCIGNKACGGSRGGRGFKRGEWRDRNAMVKERKCVERRTFARTLESSAGHFASRVSEVVASMSFEFQLFKNCPHGFWNRG